MKNKILLIESLSFLIGALNTSQKKCCFYINEAVGKEVPI